MISCRPELTPPISLPSSPKEHWGQEGLPAPLWARKPRIRKPSSTSQAGRTPELGALGSAHRVGQTRKEWVRDRAQWAWEQGKRAELKGDPFCLDFCLKYHWWIKESTKRNLCTTRMFFYGEDDYKVPPYAARVLTALGQQGLTERTPSPHNLLARDRPSLKLSSETASGMHTGTH